MSSAHKTLVELAAMSGKKLTKPENNLLAKLQADYGISVRNQTFDKATVTNRFSGLAVETSFLVEALVNFIYEINTGFQPLTYKGKNMPVSIFDRTRYLVLKLDDAAYYSLLD